MVKITWRGSRPMEPVVAELEEVLGRTAITAISITKAAGQVHAGGEIQLDLDTTPSSGASLPAMAAEQEEWFRRVAGPFSLTVNDSADLLMALRLRWRPVALG